MVFHSYKGGTGKTTIAANMAAYLARKGHRVYLLDLDVYAPSLHSYFELEPNKWMNDYLLEVAEARDVLIDLTANVMNGSAGNNSGKLWVGFCNPKKEEVYKLEGGKQEKVQTLRRFIALREEIFANLNADYLIIDTSPGIRYWSINALAVADLLYLTLKAGDLDIAGTKKMAEDIYATFKKFGAKPYLLLNRVEGYCVPRTLLTISTLSGHGNSTTNERQGRSPNLPPSMDADNSGMSELSKNVGMEIASSLPCFCDIQFSRKEYLTVLHDPGHPFSKKIEGLAQHGGRT